MKRARRGMQRARQFVESIRNRGETEPTQARSEPETRTKLECAQVRLAFAKIFISDDSTLNYLPYDVISKIGGFLSYKLLKAVIPKCEEDWIEWCDGRPFQNLSKVLGRYTLTFEDFQPGKCFHYEGGNRENDTNIKGEFKIHRAVPYYPSLQRIERYNESNREEFVLHAYTKNGRDAGIVLTAKYYTEGSALKPSYLDIGWNVEQFLVNHVTTFEPIVC